MKYLGFTVITILIMIHIFFIIHPYRLTKNNDCKKAERFFVLSMFYAFINIFLMAMCLLLTIQNESTIEEVNLIPLISVIPLSLIIFITERRIGNWYHSLNEEDKKKTLLYNRRGRYAIGFTFLLFFNFIIYSGAISHYFFN
jgi:hypothetical protein